MGSRRGAGNAGRIYKGYLYMYVCTYRPRNLTIVINTNIFIFLKDFKLSTYSCHLGSDLVQGMVWGKVFVVDGPYGGHKNGQAPLPPEQARSVEKSRRQIM